MNKLYFLLVIIIIGLVTWLVLDFMQNKTEADSILKVSLPVTTTDSAPVVFAPPRLPKTSWPGFFGPKIVEQPITVEKPIATPNFILTGTIIEPRGAKAFILIPTRSNEERICKVGDKLDDEWTIVDIIADEVTLRSNSGENYQLRITKQWAKPDTPGATPASVASKVLLETIGRSDIQLPEGISADLLKELFKDGKPSAHVEKQLEATVNALPPQYVRDMITKLTDLGKEDIPEEDEKLGKFATDLFRVVSGETVTNPPEIVLEEVSFSTRVNPDNTPIAPQNLFKTSDRRLYACFPNRGALKGLSKVVTRWTNRTSGTIEYLSSKPINAEAAYNFIWVEKKEGWPLGDYEVEILKTQTMEKVAGGIFTITQ